MQAFLSTARQAFLSTARSEAQAVSYRACKQVNQQQSCLFEFEQLTQVLTYGDIPWPLCTPECSGLISTLILAVQLSKADACMCVKVGL